jgi:hypothetical protein
MVDQVFCVDDQLVDEQVINAENVVLVDCYEGGEDTGLLMNAVRTLIKHLDADGEPVTERVK